MCSRCRRTGRLAWRAWLVGCGILLAAAACERDSRSAPHRVPPGGDRTQGVRQVPLRPGIPADVRPIADNPFAGDRQALAEGKRLYGWMNCSGCHFEGGGGIGPPLMDDDWIYGGRPEQIFDSIVNGRTNGMPAYGDKLPSEQVWQIVAYVESLYQPRDGNGR